jgi:aspartyl-tRNA synthetase
VRGGAESATRAFGKHLPEATRAELCKQLEAESGDLVFIAASTRPQIANWALGKVRVASAGMKGHCYGCLRSLSAHWEQRGKLSLAKDMFRFLWVVDFPLFDVGMPSHSWHWLARLLC